MPVIRHNLGLVLGKLMSRPTPTPGKSRCSTLSSRASAVATRRRVRRSPTVSVVLRLVQRRAVRRPVQFASVAAQTWPDIELIVIDDSSGDGSAGDRADALAGLPFPSRFVRARTSRRRRGRGVQRRRRAGERRYLAFLEGAIASRPSASSAWSTRSSRRDGRWGFSRVMPAPGRGARIPPSTRGCDAALAQLSRRQAQQLHAAGTQRRVSHANLFVERDAVRRAGRISRPAADNRAGISALRASERCRTGRRRRAAVSSARPSAADERATVDAAARTRTTCAVPAISSPTTLAGGAAGRNALGPHHPGEPRPRC